MDSSILNDVKKALGLSDDYTPFDQDIIMHINTFLGVLNQLGVGKPFHIEDDSATWSEFLEGSQIDLYAVKTFLYLRVRLVFDPPASSNVSQAIQQTIDELTWRLNVAVDPTPEA